MREAVAHYWKVRTSQGKKSKPDQGARSAVTGGAQMDGFVELLAKVVVSAGIDRDCVFVNKGLELPGFFRPTKRWDLLVVKEDMLVAVIEVKSQVGPSFGNNFNNRTEEAMGSAVDLWTAYRESAFNAGQAPFVGYLFMLEDHEKSRKVVGVKEPHFSVFPEFVDTSYMNRYELFCRKLVLERHYTAAAFITSKSDLGMNGEYDIPAADLSVERFVKTLSAHVSAFG